LIALAFESHLENNEKIFLLFFGFIVFFLVLCFVFYL